MAYFHGQFVKNRGGKGARSVRRLVGETIEEMLRVHRQWPEAVMINWPPRSKDSYKSKSLPVMWIDSSRTDILEELQSAEVDENYLRVLTWLLRELIYRTKIGHTDETRAFFEAEIRGNLIRLLKDGSWVDQPENLGLKNLNKRLEKIDLGRRKDLNFSSSPLSSAVQKYDRDFKKTDTGDVELREKTEDEMDWNAKYRDGSKELREEILTSRPWMRAMLVERYGEPE